MKDGFLKAAALSPALRVADCVYNTQQIIAQLREAAGRGVKLAVFPEFCLTGYTCGDLFLQRTLQQGALTGLQSVLDASKELDVVALVGLPLLVRGKLYNCAAVLCKGQLLGLVPKTYLPNYGEFYEKRQFTPGSTEVEMISVCGQQVPFGTSLLFRCREMPSFVLGVEICEDLWSALPPSTFHALAGATVIANLSASDETVGKAEYRRALVSNQSARLLCGYLYASAGHGESTQDMVFAGHDLIAENGTLLSETKPFAGGYAEINGHAIRDLSMTPSMLQHLAPYLEQSGEVIRFEGLNGVVRMSADAPDAPGYARTLGDAVTQLQHYSVYKILMSTSLANHIAQDKALEPLLCFNELELEVTEISPRECTKRGGIQSVLDALDPHHGTVYGIGDASNDVSLMNAVDVGIAMGNAPDYLKKRADYITDSVDKDGVVKALEHFRLI